MNREIKFRAWDIENKRFVNIVRLIFDQFGALDYAEVVFKGKIYKLYPSEIVLEQDTGLEDKNGKRICEGDIVKAKIQGFWETGTNTITEGKATWNLEVIYNDIRYMDVFHILGSKNQPGRIYYLFEEAISDIEVVGNIHENPELL